MLGEAPGRERSRDNVLAADGAFDGAAEIGGVGHQQHVLGGEIAGEAVDQLPAHFLERSVAVRLEEDEQAAGEGVEGRQRGRDLVGRSEEHTSELQSLMRISYAVFCLKKKNHNT